MLDIFAGWVVVTTTYFVSLFVGFLLFPLLFGEPWDYNQVASGYFIGAFVVIIPYVIAGLFIRKSKLETMKVALWISIVPVVSEKILIYIIGATLASTTHEGNNRTVMQFITGEALPYFTPLYFFSSVISILLCLLIATRTKRNKAY